jgi:hypothetical protein
LVTNSDKMMSSPLRVAGDYSLLPQVAGDGGQWQLVS